MSTIIRFWYKPIEEVDTADITDAKVVNGFLGYETEPAYELIERYDLRLTQRGTLEDLFIKVYRGKGSVR